MTTSTTAGQRLLVRCTAKYASHVYFLPGSGSRCTSTMIDSDERRILERTATLHAAALGNIAPTTIVGLTLCVLAIQRGARVAGKQG